MTNEEAARILDPETTASVLREYGDGNAQIKACDEACRIAAKVLINVAHIDREAWTAEWIVKGENPVQGTCSACGGRGNWRNPFCPNCGRAMMPEAWAELEKRIGGAV